MLAPLDTLSKNIGDQLTKVISGSTDTAGVSKTYTYNPDDINKKLKKIKITKVSNNIEENGVFIIGNTFGENDIYQNIYEEIIGTTKYKLSGRYNNVKKTIVWFDIMI